jgi:C-terminal processing protease CtpA/Prc
MKHQFNRLSMLVCFLFLLAGCAVATTSTTSMTTSISTTPSTTVDPTTTTSSTTTTMTTTASTTTTTTEAMEPGHYRLSELQADYDQMVRYLAFNPQIFTDQAELANVIAEQRELLTHGMTKLDFYRIIAVVVAAVRCGHSFVQVPSDSMDAFFSDTIAYPVEVRLIDNQLVVVEVTGATPLEFGDVIVSIQGQLVADALQDMFRFLTADGDGTTYRARVLGTYFFSYYRLFLDARETIEIEYVDQTTGLTSTAVLTRNGQNLHPWVEQIPYEAEYGTDYAVLTVRYFVAYGNYRLDDFYAFFETFFTAIETRGITSIVLDLRGNGGGDPRIASRLLSYLIDSPQPYFAAQTSDYYTGLKSPVPLSEPHFDGALFTLIDSFCFSTCGHFAALLRYHDIGTFIGEETNGGFVCSDSSVDLTLGYTQMRFRTSMTAWMVAVEGVTPGRGTFPDIEAAMSVEDYRLGIDRVMQTAIDLISPQQ